MKRLLITIFSIASLVSCNLNLAPENVMVDQTVYKNAKTTQAALLGAYSRMNIFLAGAPEDQNNYSYKSFCWMAGDTGTENLKAFTEGGDTDMIALETGSYDNSVRDGSILGSWIKGYNAIDYANNVIDGIARYGDFEPELMRQYTAEARFLRAFVYFNMLKMFGDGALTGNSDGLGLILRDKPYDGYNPEQIVSRSTVKQTWDFIISDIEESLEDLPESIGAAESRFRATRPVAWALLSRIYLYRGSFKNDKEDMKQAVSYAKKVLDCSEITFSTAYNDHKAKLFPANEYDSNATTDYPDPTVRSSEIIFYQPSRISTEKYCNGVSYYFYNKRVLCVEADFYSTVYLPGDQRGLVEGSQYSMIGQGGTQWNASSLTTMKYTNSAGYDDVIFIRLAEIKLNYAEALARSTGNIESDALTQLNDIRCKPFEDALKPVALVPADFSDTQDFIDEILLERNRELAFESHQRWDLMRTGRKLRNAELTDAQKVIPIPDYEVNISKGRIAQNSAFE